MTVPRWRLALLLGATVVLAVALSHVFGFLDQTGIGLREAAVDAGVAVLVGIAAATVVLTVLSVVKPLRSWDEALSVIAVEALPATVGASFARSQLGEGSTQSKRRGQGRLRETVLLVAGAVVFCSSLAPTEEIVLIAAAMSELDAILLVGLSLVLMHGFVYGLGFKGGSPSPRGFWQMFRDHTVVGYVVALLLSAYLLWTFGRFQGLALHPVLMQTLVLGLPASIGAAAGRLIV